MRQLCTELLEHIYAWEEKYSFLSNSSPEWGQVKGNKLAPSFTFEEWRWVAGNLEDIHNEQFGQL